MRPRRTEELVSVLVCTKDRPDDVLRAVRSVLASDHTELELIVIDQSEGSETERLLAANCADSRLRYVRSHRRGKGAALNEGLGIASSDVVVCTDDDCEAPCGWVRGMASVMWDRPDVAAVYCNVVAADHDSTEGYIPTYIRQSDRLLESVADARWGLGIGAGMAFRRSAISALGGLDEALGPGARFLACDDWDIGLRSLLRGWSVYHASKVEIVHHGFRSLAEGREHAYRDWLGVGATFGKFVRSGHLSVLLPAAWLFGRYVLIPPMRSLARGQRPRGLVRVLAFARGFVAGLSTRVDRRTMTFVLPT
jgi:glycosyltransferase involved in cell wall biosynthesis